MDLREKIIFERIERLDQLSPDEQAQVFADDELMALMSEHEGLSQIEPTHGAAPNMDAVLSQVFTKADNHKEHKMSLFTSIFAGKSWYAQAGLATLMLMAAAVVFITTTSETSWAATDGYALVFDFGNIGTTDDGDMMDREVKSKLAMLDTPIMEWVEERKESDVEPKAKLNINVNVDGGDLVAVVSMFGATSEMIDELTALLSEVPGLPIPTVTDTTWFSENGMDCCGGDGIDITLFNRQFSFPKSVDSETIETQINEWLAENKPELKAQVEIGESEGRIEIKIKLLEERE